MTDLSVIGFNSQHSWVQFIFTCSNQINALNTETDKNNTLKEHHESEALGEILWKKISWIQDDEIYKLIGVLFIFFIVSVFYWGNSEWHYMLSFIFWKSFSILLQSISKTDFHLLQQLQAIYLKKNSLSFIFFFSAQQWVLFSWRNTYVPQGK